jgi:hypothetical protein
MQKLQQHPHFLYFILLAVLTTVVYWPSLFHAGRADHIIYLAETAQQTTWWQTTVTTFDLNRTSQYSPGDEKLFRPLFYFIIGNERFFFGYNFFYWQLCALLAHLLVVWQLSRLLTRIYPGFSAWLLAAFFSLMCMNVEMITWHHITGYLVFVSLLLAACDTLFTLLILKKTTPQNLATAWISLCLASFIFELGVLATLLCAIAFRLQPDKNLKKFAAILLIIPAVYALLNGISLLTRKISLDTLVQGSLNATKPLWQILIAPFEFIAWWLTSAIFPSAFHLRIGPRTVIAKENSLVFLGNPQDWSIWCALLLFVLILILLFKGLNRAFLKERSFFLFILLGISGGFACQASVRSITTDTWDALRINLYYIYLFWPFFILAFFSMLDFDKLARYKWLQFMRATILSLLLLLTGHNALQTFYINYLRAHKDAPVIYMIKAIESLIQNKGNEPDFSFFIANDFPGNHVRENIPQRGKTETVTKSAAELLYPQYFTRENPKYLLPAALDNPAGQ